MLFLVSLAFSIIEAEALSLDNQLSPYDSPRSTLNETTIMNSELSSKKENLGLKKESGEVISPLDSNIELNGQSEQMLNIPNGIITESSILNEQNSQLTNLLKNNLKNIKESNFQSSPTQLGNIPEGKFRTEININNQRKKVQLVVKQVTIIEPIDEGSSDSKTEKSTNSPQGKASPVPSVASPKPVVENKTPEKIEKKTVPPKATEKQEKQQKQEKQEKDKKTPGSDSKQILPHIRVRLPSLGKEPETSVSQVSSISTAVLTKTKVTDPNSIANKGVPGDKKTDKSTAPSVQTTKNTKDAKNLKTLKKDTKDKNNADKAAKDNKDNKTTEKTPNTNTESNPIDPKKTANGQKRTPSLGDILTVLKQMSPNSKASTPTNNTFIEGEFKFPRSEGLKDKVFKISGYINTDPEKKK